MIKVVKYYKYKIINLVEFYVSIDKSAKNFHVVYSYFLIVELV